VTKANDYIHGSWLFNSSLVALRFCQAGQWLKAAGKPHFSSVENEGLVSLVDGQYHVPSVKKLSMEAKSTKP
jgi:hypothetical protein